jgi:3-hydroxyacyl-CoA dehydrogenase
MPHCDPQAVRRVAVIGTGVIGAAWTAFFLSRGLAVTATDPADGAEDRLGQFVERAWPLLAELGLPAEADPSAWTFHHAAEDAIAGADYVQENAPERLDTKRSVFAIADRLLGPGVVIASSASAMLMSPIQRGLRHPGRCVLAHPFNPPHLLPLVEISGGAETTAAAIEWTGRFFAHLGKEPILLNREISGHIAGRLGAAVWREAVSLVEQGIADVEAVDKAMRLGPGLRYALAGPHMIFHMGGGGGGLRHFIAHLGPAQERRWQELGQPRLTAELADVLVRGVEAEAGGRSIDEMEARRDAQLVAILKALGRGTSGP